MIPTPIRVFSSFAILLTASSCARYQPQPLATSSTIIAALATPPADTLVVEASKIHHPLLPPITLDPAQKLTPDTAAILAVLLNPALRAARDQRQNAQAQLLQAGILPNPQLSYNSDFISGGDTTGTFNAYGIGLSWEVTSLLTHGSKIRAAQAAFHSVRLDIAWQEWQAAEAAKLAVLDLSSLVQQVQLATDVDRQLAQNVQILQRAVDAHQKSIVDFAAADVARRDAHSTLLALIQQRDHQLMILRRSIGLPADTAIELAPDLQLPTELQLPSTAELIAGLDTRRLDIIALRAGYQSEEQTLRAAVLAQFPRISVGYNQASDNTNVHTSGFGVAIDLPIFDRNQGVIAVETATRQRLYDEYTARTYESRLDLATALTDIHAITAQIADTQDAVKSLQQLVDTYKSAYDRGNADVISYYTAISSLKQKSLDLLKLQQQLWDNQIALELAAGWYLPVARGPETRPATQVPKATEPK